MSSVSFLYTASSDDKSETFKKMRKKHLQDASIYDDNFFLTNFSLANYLIG